MAKITGTFANNSKNTYPFIEYTYTQSVANNTTTITAKLYMQKVTSYAQSWQSSCACNIKIAGATAWSATQKVDIRSTSVGSALYIGQATKTVTHNSDGTCKVALSGYIGLTGTSLGAGNVSSTITLPTIPRKTTVSVSGTKTFGSAVTINHAGASSSFTHNIKYYIGSASGTIASGKSGTSTSWTIPKSLQSQIPNTTSGTIKIVLETVSGGSVIGSSETTFSAGIASDCVPSVSSATFSDAMSKPSGITGYYQNYSKLKSVISAAGVYGSTIKTYRITVGGEIDVSSTSNTITTGTLRTNGTFNITIHVTDSRGKTASKTYTNHLVVTAYTAPTVNSFDYKRMELVDGIESPSNMGTIGYISFTRTFHSASTNKSVRFLYKTKSASSWTAITLSDQNYSNYKFSSTLSSADAYILRVELKDMLSTITKDIEMANIFPLISMNPQGNGLAFGKEATTQNIIEIAMDTFVDNKLILRKGFNVHQANAGGGTTGYIKIAQIKITGTYQNQPILITYAQRGKPYVATLEISYHNANNSDPGLASFAKTGDTNAYIHKSSAGVWDLYVQKTEGYDNIDVLSHHLGQYMGSTKITWLNELVSGIPSGYVAAVNKPISGVDKNSIGLGNVNNWGASSSISANSTSQYATTNMVYQVRNEYPKGWVNASLASGVTSEGQYRVRLHNPSLVELQVAVSGVTAVPKTICTLPSGYRPDRKLHFAGGVGATTHIGHFTIETNGAVTLQKVATGSIASGYEIQLNCMFSKS